MSTEEPIGMNDNPLGASRQLSKRDIERMVRAGGDELRQRCVEWLLPDALRSLHAAMQPRCDKCGKGPQRYAVLAVLHMAKLYGIKHEVLLAVLERFDVASESELEAIVTVSRMVDSMSEVERERRVADYLRGLGYTVMRASEAATNGGAVAEVE